MKTAHMKALFDLAADSKGFSFIITLHLFKDLKSTKNFKMSTPDELFLYLNAG